MEAINLKKSLFFLITLFLTLLLACGKRPEEARKELGQMHIEYSESSFLKCAERGDSLAVKLFLTSGMDPNINDKDGMAPLLVAAQSGRENVISILLQRGANINARDNEFGYNALFFAMASGNLNIVKLLLSNGANLTDVSKGGQTLLMRAVLVGKNVELIKYIIDKGVDINAKDINGGTALFHSMNMFTRNINTVKLLLDSGADMNATDNKGNTALIEVAASITEKSSDIMDLLLKSGANVNTANNEGETALHRCVATFTGFPYKANLIDILLKYGANPNIENNKGKTAIDILEIYQQEPMIKYEVKQIINNLINNLKKAAIANPQHLILKTNLKIRYGTIKLYEKGKTGLHGRYLYLNNKIISEDYHSPALGINKYVNQLKDDVIIIALPRGASKVFYRIISVKEDGSYSISDEFGHGGDYDKITNKDNEILISFPAYNNGKRIQDKIWNYKNGIVKKVK